MPKLTIPQIREEVQQLTAESTQLARRQLQINARINALMQETYRRSYTRAPTTSRRVTEAVRASVRRMVEDFPDMPHQDVATSHGINLGRVSEILHGTRG
jgi:hypothetical protein